jgi:hypothetical protein
MMERIVRIALMNGSFFTADEFSEIKSWADGYLYTCMKRKYYIPVHAVLFVEFEEAE